MGPKSHTLPKIAKKDVKVELSPKINFYQYKFLIINDVTQAVFNILFIYNDNQF